MLNLEENLKYNFHYNIQKDFLLKVLSYSFSIVVLIEIIRGQIAEINLLQLIPGLYFFLSFIFFFFALIFSNFFFRISINLEIKKISGTKTLEKMISSPNLFFSFSLFFLVNILNFSTILPISLDSFYSYSEKTIENLWSFTEVLILEFFFFFLLSLISQLPLSLSYFFKTEKYINFLPNFWRIIGFFLIVISGFFTPTIDGYTQLSFSFSTFFLYFLLIFFLQKRSLLKFHGVSIMG